MLSLFVTRIQRAEQLLGACVHALVGECHPRPHKYPFVCRCVLGGTVQKPDRTFRCNDPTSSLVLTSGEYGCPETCPKSTEYQSKLAALPCVDATRDSEEIKRYTNSWLNVSSSWSLNYEYIARQTIAGVALRLCWLCNFFTHYYKHAHHRSSSKRLPWLHRSRKRNRSAIGSRKFLIQGRGHGTGLCVRYHRKKHGDWPILLSHQDIAHPLPRHLWYVDLLGIQLAATAQQILGRMQRGQC